MTGESGIDAGGLYRQVLSDISGSLETEELNKFKIEPHESYSKEIIQSEHSEHEVEFILKMLILLFNTGESNFASPLLLDTVLTYGNIVTLEKIF